MRGKPEASQRRCQKAGLSRRCSARPARMPYLNPNSATPIRGNCPETVIRYSRYRTARYRLVASVRVAEKLAQSTEQGTQQETKRSFSNAPPKSADSFTHRAAYK